MKEEKGISSAALHILAMTFMLCDHLYATVFPYMQWLTCIGRLAFPIFAFLLVEGYFHTRSLSRYMLRLLIFALISEIPFDLMCASTVFYPFHQNTLWTLLISLPLIHIIERAKKTNSGILFAATAFVAMVTGFFGGIITMVDYHGAGILIVLAFYFFRGRKWYNFLGQLVYLYILNVKFIGGFYYPITLFGYEFELHRQAFALFALVPIWLYQGRQGQSGRGFKYFCYWFYPVHLILIVLLWKFALYLKY